MNRSRVNIGTYYLAPYARSEQHIRELAECGIDFVTCMGNDRPALDLMYQYGVGAILTGVVPEWFGGHGENAGQLQAQRSLESYDAALDRFEDHPAVWGLCVGDEPSALDLPWYGKIIERVQKRLPHKIAYLNLYPSYGMLASNTPEQALFELRAPSYADYLDVYCRHVNADYLCFDCYPYSSATPCVLGSCLLTASDACRRTGRDLWVILQVNSHTPDQRMSLPQLRFQAFSALAYGARVIQWACYTTGWWHHLVLDEHGEKTEQYEKLKTVNAEIRLASDACTNLSLVQTLEGASWQAGCFRCATDGTTILAGHLTGDESEALLLCAPDDDLSRAITVQTNHPRLSLITPDGKHTLLPEADGCFRLSVHGWALIIA